MTDALYFRRDDARRSPTIDRAPVRRVPSHGPPATPSGAKVSRSRRLVSALFTLALIGIVVFFWPARLGGSTRLVIVSGHSMEPTYNFGDVVVTREGKRSDVGDAVVFVVPDGPANGILVIHRILAVDDDGFFVTQGDNRDTPDQWQLTDEDIVGQPVVHVPKAGYLVWYLQQWIVIAVLAGLLTVLVLWPKKQRPDDDDVDQSDEPHEDEQQPSAAVDREPVTDGEWSNMPIDQDVMAEANAWLDEQLGDFMREAAERPPLERRVRNGGSRAQIDREPATLLQRIRTQAEVAAR